MAFTGIADIEATGENHRVAANLLTDIEQDQQKIDAERAERRVESVASICPSSLKLFVRAARILA